jgi:hypothetical protein
VSHQLTSRDWLGKASAGTLLGFVLALGLCGWFARFGPGAISFMSAQGQVTMWLMAPLWVGILSFCFLFRSGPRAWGWLAVANLFVWSALLAARLFAG